MAQKNHARGKKYSASEGLDDLANGLLKLVSEYAEINRRGIKMIADDALEIAREKLYNGNFEGHAEWTSRLTEKLSDGFRKTGSVMHETGALADSLKITVNTVAMGSIYVAIGSDLVYAAIHEYGGHPGGAVKGNGGAIPPRPYLKPAIMQAIDNAHSWLPEYLAAEYASVVLSKASKRKLVRPNAKNRGGR